MTIYCMVRSIYIRSAARRTYACEAGGVGGTVCGAVLRTLHLILVRSSHHPDDS